MGDIFEELDKIEKEVQERLRGIEVEEAEKSKAEAKKRILEIIEDPDLELDEPKMWNVVSYRKPRRHIGDIGGHEQFNKIMTQRQKMLLEETGRLPTIVDRWAELRKVCEITRKELLSNSDIAKLEGFKEKMELLKSSEDPQLNEKGLYVCMVDGEKVEIEMTLRQALLVTTPETRDYFRTYTQIKEDEDKKRMEEEGKKSSKITLKSIKNAIKSKLNIR